MTGNLLRERQPERPAKAQRAPIADLRGLGPQRPLVGTFCMAREPTAILRA